MMDGRSGDLVALKPERQQQPDHRERVRRPRASRATADQIDDLEAAIVRCGRSRLGYAQRVHLKDFHFTVEDVYSWGILASLT
ncbi:hypothetical protein [Bradyrhizobium diversitatis]|uniref:Transposase n=1 Tax=Bradyrhizobium diversitatis TaxID=2755406 RepID=A0ABS0NW73_9BRAD|nr:hypothetical protein [Bradyrhizobium diversitatis]MBH5385266.1 hypothetical protein [Bradyrhizobium diversitatis]